MGMAGGGQALLIIIFGDGHRGTKVGKGASFPPPENYPSFIYL